MKRAYVRRKHSSRERLDENRDEINSRPIFLFSSNLKIEKKGAMFACQCVYVYVCMCVCKRHKSKI